MIFHGFFPDSLDSLDSLDRRGDRPRRSRRATVLRPMFAHHWGITWLRNHRFCEFYRRLLGLFMVNHGIYRRLLGLFMGNHGIYRHLMGFIIAIMVGNKEIYMTFTQAGTLTNWTFTMFMMVNHLPKWAMFHLMAHYQPHHYWLSQTSECLSHCHLPKNWIFPDISMLL